MKPYYYIILTLIFATGYAHASDVQKSTIDDQRGVEVTVYNQNRALIKDTRSIELKKGEGELRFMDVAAYIQPETVHIKSLSHPKNFMVLEQNYEYDLMDRNKLLNKYVGKEIKLIQENMYQDVTYETDAILLSNNNNVPIYQVDGEIYLGFNGYPVLPEIPENLIAKPTLMWGYKFNGRGKNNVEVSYLTQNMSWKADYILVLNKDDTKGDLSGWVTINNQSGTAYKDAALKLVAGDVNQVRQDTYAMAKRSRGMMAMEMAADKAFTEQGFFEYHIYDLQRRTTLKNNQTKQISLLSANDFKIKKEYRVYGNHTYYNYQYRPQNPKQPVDVSVLFENKKDNGLGMPLPKGIVRLYKKDHEEKLQFAGEDRIDHTPKDEEVSLKVGEAFDVVAERRQTDFRQIRTNLYQSEWEITLKNHKDEDIVVSLIEPVHGSWSMLNASHEYKKVDAFTVRFDVPVKKDGEVKVTYRIQVGIQ